MKRNLFLSCATGVVLFISSVVWAVSDEEVQKITQAMPEKPVVQPAKPRTLLVFNLSNGFKHSCIPYWQKALEIMGPKTGAFKVEQSSDMSVFNEESLKAFDAICFNNTTKLTPDEAQQKAILDFIRSGKGIVGIHAATDNFDNWPEGAMMMGGIFKGHPWTANGTWTIKIDEPQHPLMKPFAGKGFQVNDEIYRTLPPQYSRAGQRVLMSLDMSDAATANARGVTPEDADTGISWIKPVGKGRLFYCSLGHNHHLTWTTPVLEHYLAGIQYALGDLKVEDAPVKTSAAMDVDKVSSLVEQIKSYDWDKSRGPLAEMEALVREHSDDPSALKKVEGRILEALQSDSTLAAKDFFCRMLAAIGTEDCVPVLTKMLQEDSTFNMARLALEQTEGPKAEQALVQALAAAKKSEQKSGLMTSLGRRKSNDAVTVIAAGVNDQNAVVAEAAIEALAAIGSEQAAQSLRQTKVNPQLQARLHDALLRCANASANSGQTKRAQEIYGGLYTGQADAVINAGALLGLAKTGDPKANEYVMTALTSSEPMLVRAASTALAATKDKALLGNAAAMVQKLAPEAQVQVLTALSENEARIGAEASIKLAPSPQQEVRMAAYQALATLGDEKSVLLLAGAAAGAREREERLAAQEALTRLQKVDRTIVDGIKDETIDSGARVELIQAAVERQSENATAVLFETAYSTNAKIAEQSVRGLQSLAGPNDVEAMTKLLIKQPNANTENALAAAAMRMTDKESRADTLLKYYAATEDSQAKATLLRVLGKLGDTDAVSLLEKESNAADAIIREGAFRGMTEWPGQEFTSKMKEIAQSSEDSKQKVLAFRAYVRMLGDDEAGLIDAFEMAERPEDKTIVISSLANSPGEQSIRFLRTLWDDPQLQTEAQMGLLRICEKKLRSGEKPPTAVLRKLAGEGSTEMIRRRASMMLRFSN